MGLRRTGSRRGRATARKSCGGVSHCCRAPRTSPRAGPLAGAQGRKGGRVGGARGGGTACARERPVRYVYAVGLHSTGKRDAALAELRGAEARHPYDLEILGALVSMNREAGNPGNAFPYARKITEILPDDPGVKRLLSELERGK